MKHAYSRSLVVGILLVVGGLLAWTPVQAADQRPDYRSRYFDVYSGLPEAEAMRYAGQMDLIHGQYVEYFRSFLPGGRIGRRPKLYLFPTREQFIARLAELGFDVSHIDGVFFDDGKGASGLASWVHGHSPDVVRSVLQHEGFHQFAHVAFNGEMPLWANEGLAEYFGDAFVSDGAVRMGGIDHRRAQELQAALGTDKLIPFREMLTISDEKWEQNIRADGGKASLQYTQAWSMVHFMLHGAGGRYRPAFEQFLRRIRSGSDPQEAMIAALGNAKAVDDLEEAWRTYLAEMEPDRFSTAIARMQFVGSLLQMMQEAGREAPPTMQALLKQLRGVTAYIERPTHGGPVRTYASDPSNYRYSDHAGTEHLFELTAPTGQGLPPGVWAPQLEMQPRLVWSRDIRHQPQYEIQLDAAQQSAAAAVDPEQQEVEALAKYEQALQAMRLYARIGQEHRALPLFEAVVQGYPGTRSAEQAAAKAAGITPPAE